ncbi:hypothetical protein EVAR_58990_1 [Eumeta japonica]|uniref:Secreted protein n=1 Tax=Eumeta variegata TaxID=151549 RepID=A0A4C1YIN1_EUMVA|nr:hypothetical protein EVAR_58990_1 [Eumeta japonica]
MSVAGVRAPTALLNLCIVALIKYSEDDENYGETGAKTSAVTRLRRLPATAPPARRFHLRSLRRCVLRSSRNGFRFLDTAIAHLAR